MTNPSAALALNPLYDALAVSKVRRLVHHEGLERTYYLSKTKKVLKALKFKPALRTDLKKIDHNAFLDLYEGNEYIFGPFMDANEQDYGLVYLLYTNRINQDNELQVLYAGRVLAELEEGRKLELTADMRDEGLYKLKVDAMEVIKPRLSLHCYYRAHRWSPEEVLKIRQLYGADNVQQPRYNSLRENFACSIGVNGQYESVNPFRLLYEIHHVGRRLTKDEVVSPVNGRKADLRPDNVMMRNLKEEDRIQRERAYQDYGLDTYALERIYARIGYNRFRGLYDYGDAVEDSGNRNRKYVKLVKDGTDIQLSVYLSRALLAVQEDRALLPDETVDHIDHDKTNDSGDNLRMISRRQHVKEDSVKLEIDPVSCVCCGRVFQLTDKEFSYYKLQPSLPTCTDKCKSELRKMDKETKEDLLAQKNLTFRYYVVGKNSNQRFYFPSLDYKECRRILSEQGKAALSTTPFPETIG